MLFMLPKCSYQIHVNEEKEPNLTGFVALTRPLRTEANRAIFPLMHGPHSEHFFTPNAALELIYV